MELIDEFSSKMIQSRRSGVESAKTALIVVDMVNDYLDPTGSMPVADSDGVVEAARNLVNFARQGGCLIVWVRPGHTELRDGLFKKRIPHSVGDVFGAELHPSLPFERDDKVIRKRRYSAFFSTDLDLFLREHEIDVVVICGVALNICVRSTVHDAFFLGYEVFVVEDACKATGQREHDSTLYDISTHFGTVVSLVDFQKMLPDGRHGDEILVKP